MQGNGRKEKARWVTREGMEIVVTSYGGSLRREGSRGIVIDMVHCLLMHFIILFTPIL